MNAQLLTRLVKALQPDSILGKLAAPMLPTGPRVPGGSHMAHHHTRAGVTKNRGRKRNKARVKMAKASRKVNRR